MSAGQLTQRLIGNAQWSSGRTTALATVNVGGRVVSVPVGLSVAANAASFVAPFIRATPYGLLGSAVLAWIAAKGPEFIDGQWQVLQGGQPESLYKTGCTDPYPSQVTPLGVICLRSSGNMEYLAYYPGVASGGSVPSGWTQANNVSCSSYPASCGGVTSGYGGIAQRARVVCPSGPADVSGACPGLAPASVEQLAAALDGPIPDAALTDLARLTPVPVQLPEIEPQRVPVGSPVAKPGTIPQQYVQPFIDVVPRPTLAEPWRVDLVPVDVTSEDPVGVGDVTPIGEETPEGEPGAGEPKPELCDLYPDVLACQKMGTLNEEVLPQSTVSVAAITPESGFGEGAGSCPEPRTGTVMGRQVAMTWQPMCDLANGIRPVVIAVAWLAAIAGFLGLSRKDA